MFSLSKPIGRLKFLALLTPVNIAIFVAASSALAFRPTGGGHLAVLIVVGALQALWFLLHSKRFADAGRGRVWPIAAFAICFLTFALGYVIMAALWSSPEIQREAFRTGGKVVDGGFVEHIETNPLLLELGRNFKTMLGSAGAVILSGLVVSGMAIVSIMSFIFSCVALVLPHDIAAQTSPLTQLHQTPAASRPARRGG
jgi:hypothetical protein